MTGRIVSFLLALALLAMGGCQATPEQGIVTSKNDGVFEAALEKKPEEASAAEDGGEVPAPEAETRPYAASFTSADGHTTYTVDTEIPSVDRAVPVLQVRPHEITPEEAKTFAEALFDGAQMYEYGERTKSEIEEEILSIRQRLSDTDALLADYGGDAAAVEGVASILEDQLEKLEDACETARDGEPIPCEWTFYPESHYNNMASDPTYCIKATTTFDGLPYQFFVDNRNEADYRLHMISAFPADDGDVYSTEATSPSAEEVAGLRDRVESMLEKMGLSDWVIVSCQVRTDTNVVELKAQPVYEGIPVTWQAQLENLKTGDEYASNYYYESINIQYYGGKLLWFSYQSPMDAVQTVNADVEILSVDEIIDIFESQMKVRDSAFYQRLMGDGSGELSVDALVDKVEFGLTRTRIKDNATDFYLIPTYTFAGSFTIDSIPSFLLTNEDTYCFVTINAVDGSVINTQLGC